MKIRNTSNKVIGVSNGVFLLPDTTATVNDNLADNVTIKVLIERGMLAIVEGPKPVDETKPAPEAAPKSEPEEEPMVEVAEEAADEPVENEPQVEEKPKRTRRKKTESAE